MCNGVWLLNSIVAHDRDMSEGKVEKSAQRNAFMRLGLKSKEELPDLEAREMFRLT